MYCDLNDKTLTSHQIPDSWKAATICPVPKRSRPSTLNDYWPIALTSVLMKCLKISVLRKLKKDSKRELDPFQFAYRQNKGVEDAVLTLIHETHSHTNNKESYASILYVDFSSAFNTVQTHLLLQKLRNMNICPHLSLWVADFLSNRTQSVCVKKPPTELPSSSSAVASSSSSSSYPSPPPPPPPSSSSKSQASPDNSKQDRYFKPLNTHTLLLNNHDNKHRHSKRNTYITLHLHTLYK